MHTVTQKLPCSGYMVHAYDRHHNDDDDMMMMMMMMMMMAI